MEIFNCSTSISYSRSFSRRSSAFRSFKAGSAIPLRLNLSSLKGFVWAFVKKIRTESFSFVSESLQTVCSSFLKYGPKYWWIPLCGLSLVSLPVFIDSYLQKKASIALPVEFMAPDMERIDSIMNEFAFSDSSYYDKDGNVLTSDGSLLVNTAGIRESVTYQNYTVKSGESISSISRKFGLSNISTLIAVNNIENVRSLRAGQKIRIPSADGLIHLVQSGENLTGLSARYSVTVEDILDTNELSSEVLVAGQKLFIPGAKLDSESLQKAMGELFTKPIHAKWRLTSRFGLRPDPFTGVTSRHSGIDMACPTGTAIYSSLSGKVSFTGYSSIYGNYVIINHYDGYQTLYGHMSKITCKKGQSVTQNTKIGLVGNTGYSTGPHLHFSVYKNGKLIDPLSLMK
ncbi:peptidoglycan DD-metalloendopeptidase family protein [Treponema sp.]|uniref:peptidoglycan DD-metalloendopeptidase family protein n=1 Tax=Treponema sp. TaxID=166 RepID=UPI0025EA087C|nr:M23 family metallopeptidase [Treponema sp.]MCR5218256.1 M23 family metallopeptidase [Treponema sp.]